MRGTEKRSWLVEQQRGKQKSYHRSLNAHAQAWYVGCICRSSCSPYKQHKAELGDVKAAARRPASSKYRAKVWMALESTLTIAKLRDLHLPDDPSDPHRICVMGKGLGLLMVPQMFFYKNCSILEKRAIADAFTIRIPLIVSSFIKKLMRPKRVFWLSPLMSISVEKKNKDTCWKNPSSVQF